MDISEQDIQNNEKEDKSTVNKKTEGKEDTESKYDDKDKWSYYTESSREASGTSVVNNEAKIRPYKLMLERTEDRKEDTRRRRRSPRNRNERVLHGRVTKNRMSPRRRRRPVRKQRRSAGSRRRVSNSPQSRRSSRSSFRSQCCQHCGYRSRNCRRSEDRRRRNRKVNQRRKRTDSKTARTTSGLEAVQVGPRCNMLSPLFVKSNEDEPVSIPVDDMSYAELNYPVNSNANQLQSELAAKLEVAAEVGIADKVVTQTEIMWCLSTALRKRHLTTDQMTLFWKIYENSSRTLVIKEIGGRL